MGNSNSKNPASVYDSFASADPKERKSFDYIIIGGGSAGCVLASRLSESSDIQVLLLEAGSSAKDHFFASIPLGFSQLFKSAADWNYETVPQPESANRRIYIPRGKILGGSGSINCSIYQHCLPDDLAEWEREGATGWDYRTLKPYFDKSDHYIPVEGQATSKTRRGTWYNRHTMLPPMSQYVIDACATLGIPRRHDANASEPTVGVGNFMANIAADGKRSSPATAYLSPDVLSRPNLTVATGAVVEKILVEKDGAPRATGVQFTTVQRKQLYYVFAGREVILCAGAIATPQLLLLSGIGPASEVRKHDIELVQDLPAVGKNLYDHISTGPLAIRSDPEITWDHYIYKPLSTIGQLLSFLMFGTGVFASLAAPTGAFVRSDDNSLFGAEIASRQLKATTAGDSTPDIELIWFPFLAVEAGDKPPSGAAGLTASAVLLKPESSGEITLSGPSIFDKPLVDYRLLTEGDDAEKLTRGLKLILKVTRTSPLADKLRLTGQTTNHKDFFWPVDADASAFTTEELITLVKERANSAWHPTSTARMGASRTTSVVDSNLCVHGVTGLRIVDASVFPKIVSGHPHATVIAVAERAADLIKRDHENTV